MGGSPLADEIGDAYFVSLWMVLRNLSKRAPSSPSPSTCREQHNRRQTETGGSIAVLEVGWK